MNSNSRISRISQWNRENAQVAVHVSVVHVSVRIHRARAVRGLRTWKNQPISELFRGLRPWKNQPKAADFRAFSWALTDLTYTI